MGSGQSLNSVDPDTLPNLPCKGEVKKCRVCSVHDGDTVTIVYMVGNSPFKINLRMEGIDAPEITSKNTLEKEAGLQVRDWLKNTISEHKYWYVIPKKWDKYGGRIVGTLHYKKDMDSISVNEQMLKLGIVLSYGGGKKKIWTKSMLYNIMDMC